MGICFIFLPFDLLFKKELNTFYIYPKLFFSSLSLLFQPRIEVMLVKPTSTSHMRYPGLPDQNKLYAYYLSRCGHYRVGRPHEAVLKLLTEDEPSFTYRLEQEAAMRGVAAVDLATMEDDEDPLQLPSRATARCLSRRRVFRLDADSYLVPIYIGPRGMMPLLDLIAELPLVEELDLSNIASWFDGDVHVAMRQGEISGNAVVEHLCAILPRLVSLKALNIRGQPLGCMAAAKLVSAVAPLTRIVQIGIDSTDIDYHLLQMLRGILQQHKEVAAALPLPVIPKQLPPYLSELPILDRKSIREQQQLRVLLEKDSNFSPFLTEADLHAIVLSARTMSTTEAIMKSGKAGLQGDGEHLFLLKSGELHAFTDLKGIRLCRGDYYGDPCQDILFAPARLIEQQRGVVYAIPLCNCATLLKGWASRVKRSWDFLHRIPLLQPLGVWGQLRVCSCTQLKTFKPLEMVMEAGDEREALYVVWKGSFLAKPTDDAECAPGRRYTSYSFHPSDVFGVEAMVARSHCSSVRITAEAETNAKYQCFCITGCGLQVLTRELRSVFMSMARYYSTHEDLRPLQPFPLDYRKAITEAANEDYCI